MEAKKSFPSLIVFDCDMCLWSPEMYVLRSLPTVEVRGEIKPGAEGVIGAKNNEGEVVKLFPGALKALQDYAEGRFPEYTRIAAASSADTPYAVKCALSSMETLEVLPGLKMKELFRRGFEEGFIGNLQIGRTGLLSPNKTTHFTQLHKETGIAFSEMLFFDDCNWGNPCKDVREGCPGVVTMQTPNGMTTEEFENGLKLFASRS